MFSISHLGVKILSKLVLIILNILFGSKKSDQIGFDVSSVIFSHVVGSLLLAGWGCRHHSLLWRWSVIYVSCASFHFHSFLVYIFLEFVDILDSNIYFCVGLLGIRRFNWVICCIDFACYHINTIGHLAVVVSSPVVFKDFIKIFPLLHGCSLSLFFSSCVGFCQDVLVSL